MTHVLRFVSTVVLISCCWSSSAWAASHPPASGHNGMVAADSEAASRAGVDVLEAGGNAADAAVATALVLGVVQPYASGIGGGGFALYYNAADQAVTVFDFRERAPASATPDMFIVDGEVSRDAELHSGLAVGVPGEIAGLWELHSRFGQLPWAQVVAPAIEIAEGGVTVSHHLADMLEAHRETILTNPSFAPFVGPDGSLVSFGQQVARPALARTLRAVAESGPEAFYEGEVAQRIVDATRAAGGLMTLEDLAAYRVIERQPTVGEYRGYTLYTMPPPSSGGIAMLQILSILEGFDLASMGHGSSAYIHHLAEALQFGFADRAQFLGDPAFVEVPTERLLDPELTLQRRLLVDPEHTLPREAYGIDAGTPPDDSGTSHLSVVDSSRNLIALTTTINTTFGSLLVPQDTGIVLNNEMADFTAQVGVPNVYGLLGNEANTIAPGKTPLSSMSPTLVLRDGSPFMTVGASGGPRIITATLQTFLNVVDFDMTVREAVEAPRVHHQWVPERLFYESGVPADVTTNLHSRGHDTGLSEALGAVQAIVVNGGLLTGASDPRKGGSPAGY